MMPRFETGIKPALVYLCCGVFSQLQHMLKGLRSNKHRALRYAITQAREAAGLTQRVLAARMSINQSIIAKIESGERRLDVVEFLKLCEAIGVDAREIIGRVMERHETKRS